MTCLSILLIRKYATKDLRGNDEKTLSTLKSFALTTVWLDDPDGITNYFAETAVSGNNKGTYTQPRIFVDLEGFKSFVQFIREDP
jgi:hypothetical protein